MRKLVTLLLLLIVVTVFNVKAQSPVSVVNDPKANATLTILSTLQKEVTAAVKKTKEATETLSNFEKMKNDAARVITTVATIRVITQLLTDLSCQMQQLQTSVAMVDQIHNCAFKLDYNIMLMKLQGTTDLIKIGLVGGNAYMAINDKTSILTTVMITLENSIKDMQKINNQISASAMDMLRNRYSRNHIPLGSVAIQR